MIKEEEILALEKQFTYHPPKSKWRIKKHDTVNKAALEFAKVIWGEIDSERYKERIIDCIQTARMLANQAITFQEIEEDNFCDSCVNDIIDEVKRVGDEFLKDEVILGAMEVMMSLSNLS